MSIEDDFSVDFDITKYPTEFRSTQEQDRAYTTLRRAAAQLHSKYQEVQVLFIHVC